jgi:adenosine/AMP kinase
VNDVSRSPVNAVGMQLMLVSIENPEGLNLILGQSHFVKTVEDIHEAGAGAVIRHG